MLRAQLRGRSLRLTDYQRRRLAAKGKLLGRRLFRQLATIVTPDTTLRWHRRLIAARWTHPQPALSRRGIMQRLRRLVGRMAIEIAA